MHNTIKLVAAAGPLALAQNASAADCKASTIKGVWGFSYDAIDLQGGRNCVGVGLMTFNTGTLSNNSVRITAQRNSCNGDPALSFAASGTYSVAPACTGKSTNLKYSSNDSGAKLDFNIVENGTRLQFILVQSNGLALHGEAFKR